MLRDKGSDITRKLVYAGILILMMVLCACGNGRVSGCSESESEEKVEAETGADSEGFSTEGWEKSSELETQPELIEEPQTEITSESETPSEIASESEQRLRPVADRESHLIAIDAGHQRHGNYSKEPVGPGASEKKAKVSDGTQGVVTRLAEYELNLAVAKKLRDELESRGYQVYMVRETNDVDISNAERAQAAYDSGADIFVRIHANGSEDSSAHGAFTICPTSDNPYIAELYDDCKCLATEVLNHLAASAGCKKRSVWETDTMSGINWSLIPVTIIEMGYMSNSEEDRKLASDDYQTLIAIGIADGIEAYYGSR